MSFIVFLPVEIHLYFVFLTRGLVYSILTIINYWFVCFSYIKRELVTHRDLFDGKDLLPYNIPNIYLLLITNEIFKIAQAL